MAAIVIVVAATRAGQKFIGPRKHISFSQRNPFSMGHGQVSLCVESVFTVANVSERSINVCVGPSFRGNEKDLKSIRQDLLKAKRGLNDLPAST